AAAAIKYSGCLIKRLDRQGRWVLDIFLAHSRIRDACAHLYKAVESAASCPRPSPAVRTKTNVDQPRVKLLTRTLAEPEPLQHAGSVAMNQNVGGSQEVGKTGAIAGVVQIKTRAPFADCYLGDDTGFVPGRRVDAQDVCAKCCQKPRRDGACKDAREIENTRASQRASRLVADPARAEDRGPTPMEQRA